MLRGDLLCNADDIVPKIILHCELLQIVICLWTGFKIALKSSWPCVRYCIDYYYNVIF